MKSVVYNRKTKEYENDIQYGGKMLEFMYNNPFGRVILYVAIQPFVSIIGGIFESTRLSTLKIKKFIKKNNIDMSEYEDRKYKSFNDFFTRKKKNLTFDKNVNHFISPCDSRLRVYKVSEDLTVTIKNNKYTLNELLNNDLDYSKYKNGNVMIFRLAVDNYHRYCFIDEGRLMHSYHVKGKFHTVSHIAERHHMYAHNSRVVNMLHTKNFDDVIYVEVGALMVGKIVNHDISKFNKGDEKGYFKFGGSTVVVITKDIISIDKDILKNSNSEIETKVSFGERIGIKNK